MRVNGLVLLMTLAAGCAGSTTPITMESGEPVPADRILQRGLTEPAPGRSAKVSVLRDSGFYGAGCTHTIDVDGNPVFAIKAGERQTVYLPPGAHELTLRIIKGLCPEYSQSRRVVLRENEEKVFRIFIASPTSGPDIVDLSQSAGEVASTARFPQDQLVGGWDKNKWTLCHATSDGEILVCLRPNETMDNWTRLVQVRIMVNQPGVPSPDEYVAEFVENIRKNCSAVSSSIIDSRPQPSGRVKSSILFEVKASGCSQHPEEKLHHINKLLYTESNIFLIVYNARTTEISLEERDQYIRLLSEATVTLTPPPGSR